MSEERIKNKKKTIFLIALLAVVVAIGTYAWFTFSQVTVTDTAKARTGEEDIALYISSEGGDAFQEGKEADIIQSSEGDKEDLMPVSTADLKTFLFSQSGMDKHATGFAVDEKGKYYFKGRVYLKATSKKENKDKQLDLYLDGAEGPIVEPDDGSSNILNGSRAALLFDEENPIIFWLSSAHNENDEYKNTAIIDGQEVGDGKVLTKSGDRIVAVDDPSVNYEDYVIDAEAEVPTFPEKPVFSMEFNKIYAVDVFFYLEGCDSDCTEALALQGLNLNFAFYGVLSKKADGE